MSKLQNDFEKLARLYIKREGIESLLESISKSDFYTAPASTRSHHSYEGGLVEHSIEVFEHLFKDIKHDDRFTHESIAIVSLFHDLCKVGYYTTEMRNKKNEQGKWIQVPFYTVDDLLPLGHGEKSTIMILEHMKLTTEEVMAIRWHMGLSVPKEEYGTMSKAFTEYPLAMYTHFADMKSAYSNKGGKLD